SISSSATAISLRAVRRRGFGIDSTVALPCFRRAYDGMALRCPIASAVISVFTDASEGGRLDLFPSGRLQELTFAGELRKAAVSLQYHPRKRSRLCQLRVNG